MTRSVHLLAALVGMAISTCATGQTLRTPTQWLDAQVQAWQATGHEVRDLFGDVVVAIHPVTGQRWYVVRPPDDQTPIDWRQWRRMSSLGTEVALRSYPDPRQPTRRLMLGVMLYEGRLRDGPGGGLAGDSLADRFHSALERLHAFGINTIVYPSYMTPDQWPTIERSADAFDIDLIVQYHGAYFQHARGPAHARRQIARSLGLLEVAHRSPRLLAFAVKEEPYIPEMAALEDVHDALRGHYPEVPIYTLYNTPGAMRATRPPGPHLMAADQYPFLGAMFGGGRARPSFLTPDKALGYGFLGRRLLTQADAALARGAVFSYTPSLSGYTTVITEAEARKRHWPTEGFPGIHRADDGEHLIYWRRYNPPPGTLGTSLWVAAAYGAKGWINWSSHVTMPWLAPIDADGSTKPQPRVDERPMWREYVSALRDLQRDEAILLGLVPDGLPRVQTSDPHLTARSHRRIGQDADDLSRTIILVNTDVGRWPGYPKVDFAARNLDIDEAGNLIGWQPLTEPRTVRFTVRMAEDEVVYDMRDGVALSSVAQHGPQQREFQLQLAPGHSALLYVGTPAGWRRFSAEVQPPSRGDN